MAAATNNGVPLWCLQVMSVRIFTVNQGDEALIRVNSGKPITLEFPGHLVTVYEDKGVIFQRIEKQQDPEEQTQELEEEEADPYDETQELLDGYASDRTELDDNTADETQIEVTPPWSTPQIVKDALEKATKYMKWAEGNELCNIRRNLFGHNKN